MQRRGNKDDIGVPHGVYPTKGDDNWIAITVFNDKQWRQLNQLIGDKDLIESKKFSTFEGRRINEDELNKKISQWTSNYDNRQLMELLQSNGVPAGIVLDAEGTHNDQHLKFRNHFWRLKHSEIGNHTYDGHAFRFSKTPTQPEMPAPCVGEHNYEVYTEMLGFSDEEFATLVEEEVID